MARGAMLSGGFAVNKGVAMALEAELFWEQIAEDVGAIGFEEDDGFSAGFTGSIVAKRSNAGGGEEEDDDPVLSSFFESRSFALVPSATAAAVLMFGVGSASNILSTLDAMLLYSSSI